VKGRVGGSTRPGRGDFYKANGIDTRGRGCVKVDQASDNGRKGSKLYQRFLKLRGAVSRARKGRETVQQGREERKENH